MPSPGEPTLSLPGFAFAAASRSFSVAYGDSVDATKAHRVLADLEHEGYIERERVGRRNHYSVNVERPMRHPSVSDREIGRLLAALTP